MAHTTHTMAHAMGAHVAEFKARAATATTRSCHPRAVASASIGCALAMDRCATLAVSGSGAPSMDRSALTMNRAEVLRMHCSLA